MEKLYKILQGGRSCHGGDLEWSLPKKKGRKWVPGKWHTIEGDLKMCQQGIHLTSNIWRWYKYPCEVYEAEAKDIETAKVGDDKLICRSARLLKPVNFNLTKQLDKWIAEIKAVRYFSVGRLPAGIKVNVFEDRAAGWAAGWDAAWNAARGTAWHAAYGATWDVARTAAWNAAWDATWDAARDAARGAAWTAAWNAARDVAWAAAWNAARDATWGTAGVAALACLENTVCADLKIAGKHRKDIRAMWKLTKAGYGVLGELGGIFWIYKRP